MISAIKAYLTGKVTAAGIPAARISDDPDQAAEWPPPQVPYAELRTEPERLERDGKLSARVYDGATQTTTQHRRLFRREMTVRLAIVHKTEAGLDALVTAFLAGLDKGFADGNQTILVSPRQAKWGGPEQPRDRRRAEILIAFQGGVYTTDAGLGTLQDVNMPTVNFS